MIWFWKTKHRRSQSGSSKRRLQDFCLEPPLVGLASTVGANEKMLSQASSYVGSVFMRFNIFDKAELRALLAAFGILVINGIRGGCLSKPVTSSADID